MTPSKAPHSAFQHFAIRSAELVGSWGAFVIAVGVILAWAITGHLFNYSDTWQLWINTGTTIVTFLMVFLIQYTQNRDAKAMHLKLDELLRAIKGARTEMINLKDMSDDELEKLEKAFDRLARYAGHTRTAAALTREARAAGNVDMDESSGRVHDMSSKAVTGDER
jgi:low affinity Fe/Cu permease